MISINHNLAALDAANTLTGHYCRLGQSVKRLSSGLRVNSSADDAAGLAIRELMRGDIAALNQGARNANDAISMIQVADGALAIIDEKLIRMKELAEQAATGTYDSTQRLMIHSEFAAMGEEIDRIARATDFNGIKLLDGSLSGQHNGKDINAAGAIKIHFGSGNDPAEDYYYVTIGDCTLGGLGLRESPRQPAGNGGPASMLDLPGATAAGYSAKNLPSGLVPMGYIPKGSRNVVITIDGQFGEEDDIQLFTRDGCHLSGTRITGGADNDYSWSSNNVRSPADASLFMTEANGFLANAGYKLPGGTVSGSFNDGLAGKTEATWNVNNLTAQTYSIGGKSMTISYSGDYDRLDPGTMDGRYDNLFDNNNKYPVAPNNGWITDLGFRGEKTSEKIVIDEAAEDILVIISGKVQFDIDAQWDYMPTATQTDDPVELVPDPDGEIVSITTQASAQKALEKINRAMINKDKIRAHLGALQNRLENSVANITIQKENLGAAESRISDIDIATEMTAFVRAQVITQAAVAMLGQANIYPQMLSELING